MQAETIKTGKCPVCGSNEVFDNRGKLTAYHRKYITVSATKGFVVDVCVCTSCGYFKEFIRDDDIKNEKLMNKVKEKWNRTSGGGNIG